MRRIDLLKKEILSVRSRLPALLVLLVILPAVFAGASLVFEDVIPRDSPVAVVPADETVTSDETGAVADLISVFGDTVEMENMEEAERALVREEVYGIIEVPPGFVDEGGTFVVHAHGAIVPYDEPSKLMVSILDSRIDRIAEIGGIESDIDVDRNVIGEKRNLSEYLAPILLMALVFILGLTYVPHELRRERRALERLRLETSLVAVVVTKVGFLAALLAVPVIVFAGASWYLGYSTDFLSLPSFIFLIVTFVYLSFLSTGVALASGFSPQGRFANVIILFAAIILSNIIYPVGFFSSLRRDIARLLPTHYSALAYRSHVTKDIEVTLFSDHLAILLGFTVLTFAFLYASARRYEGR